MKGYGKCWKNHAAVRGGFNCDGCQEFMPSERDHENCVACGCHRCFHCEKYSPATLVNGAVSLPLVSVAGQSGGQTQAFAPVPITALLPGSPPRRNQTPTRPVPLPLRRRGQSRANLATPAPPIPAMAPVDSGVPMQRLRGSERRVRLPKLSEGQKKEMRSFAERLGWRVREEDEEEVKTFCADMGLRANWLKLWMHKTRPASVSASASASNVDTTSNPTNHA